MNNKISRIGTLLALLLPGVAMAGAFEPADFAFSGDKLNRQLDLKSSFGQIDSATAFYCQASISAAGEAAEVDCFNKDGFVQLEDQVITALRAASYTPARVRGETVPVRMNFRVIVAQRQGEQKVDLVRNLGTLQAELGLDYVEPQERLDRRSWYQYYSAAGGDTGGRFLADSEAFVRLVAEVEATGHPSKVGVLEADAQHQRHAKAMSKGLRNARFIPGFAAGEAQDMPYVAIVNFGFESQLNYNQRMAHR